MSKKRKCLDCWEDSYTLLKDPRTPPLGSGNCLCRSCLFQAIELLVEEKEDEINDLKTLLRGARE